jgi:hypothetical protein
MAVGLRRTEVPGVGDVAGIAKFLIFHMLTWGSGVCDLAGVANSGAPPGGGYTHRRLHGRTEPYGLNPHH